MPIPEIQQLDSPPPLDKPVPCVLIDGSITYSADLRSQAEMAFTLPTPVGESPPFYLLSYKGTPYYYVHFHGVDFTTASKNVQTGFTGTWYVIHKLGVRDAISGAAAGSIHPDMKPGDLVVMDDFVGHLERVSGLEDQGREEIITELKTSVEPFRSLYYVKINYVRYLKGLRNFQKSL